MYTAKDSISSWWILIFIALMLWYRNEGYDRVFAILVVILSIVQLIEYGVHSGANTQQAARGLFVTLWVQCLAVIIATYIYVKYCSPNRTDNTTVISAAAVSLIVFALSFIIILILAMTYYSFNSTISSQGIISWYTDGYPMLKYLGWVYVIGLALPLIILLADSYFQDIGLIVVLAYILISAIYIAYNYTPEQFTADWSYISVGLGFVVWFVGILRK